MLLKRLCEQLSRLFGMVSDATASDIMEVTP